MINKSLPKGAPKIATVLALCLLAVAACSRNAISEKPPEAGDKAVAKVGDRTVWASDVKREAVAQGLIGQGEPLDISSDLFRQAMDSVIDRKLLAAEALQRKLDQNPLAQHRLAASRDQVLGDMLVESSVGKAVNDNAIRGLYAELQKSGRPAEEFKARQIVSSSEADSEAIKKLIAAGASFETLAMGKSIDAATRFSGGDLGDYFTTDVMPDGYEAALKDAKTGQLVGPFKTENGWVLMKVEDRRAEEQISIDAARPQIVRFLIFSQVKDLLENLRKGTKITVLIPAPANGGREPDAAPIAPGALPMPAAPPIPAPGAFPPVQKPATPTPASKTPAAK
jgi:peptidyl-prolyl cis-trans isomerase C